MRWIALSWTVPSVGPLGSAVEETRYTLRRMDLDATKSTTNKNQKKQENKRVRGRKSAHRVPSCFSE